MGGKWVSVATRHRAVLLDLLLAAAVIAFTIPTTAIGSTFSLWGHLPHWLQFLVGSVTAATMLIRRRTPWPAIIASAACACITGQTVPMILAAFSMTAERRVRRWPYVALMLMPVYMAVDYVNPYTDEILYLIVVRAATLVYLPMLAGTWVCEYRRLISELRIGVHEREELAASEERRRIAREMHDTVTHAVTTMVLNAGLIQTTTDPAENRELSAGIEDKGVQALNELRQLLTVLRREDMPSAAGVDGIPRLVKEAEDTGLRVSLHLDIPPNALPPQIAHACYRIVQEGLSNVRKHAPNAQVRVTCESTDDQLHVAVINSPDHADRDGSEIPRAASHTGGSYGLAGIKERVALAGGRLTTGPTPDGGFALVAWLPLPADKGRR
ncbi:sensor histidine kinase [Actinomadura alba]|uniref:histidine kinase n=1 Tax=Actinomadura alba TaxID=406431 RepID=A0ABR7LJZ7_9ACTN|nr:sensor histidine kinase [Actinomadura alba]MBC6465075.1 sensor histidine kinase [Actinomadura alba]